MDGDLRPPADRGGRGPELPVPARSAFAIARSDMRPACRPRTRTRHAGRMSLRKMHALFLSPHLDDAAFSCGATVAALPSDTGGEWRCTVATAFTRSVPDPRGFALDCQLDKGLPADVDYMKLRRAEDERACDALGAACAHLDLPEAPHRGYGSAAALFAGPRADDGVRPELAAALRSLIETDPPGLLFAPAGCGNHVDHLQLIAALAALKTGRADAVLSGRAVRHSGAGRGGDCPRRDDRRVGRGHAAGEAGRVRVLHDAARFSVRRGAADAAAVGGPGRGGGRAGRG